MTAIVLWPAAALAQALREAVDDVVVIDGNMDTRLAVSPDWQDTVNDVTWRVLVALQSAHATIPERGGRILVVVPTIGMSGAAGLSASTTALEGVRAMVKSAARQWGAEGIAVNMVAAPARLFTAAPEVDSHLSAPAYGDHHTLVHSVVEASKFLQREDLPHLTGHTVVVDGGSVMLP